MQRVTKHKTVLNKILRDERLSPNRRLLGEMLALWLDSQDKDEKATILKLIEANFGSPKRTLWGEGNSPELKTSLGQIEAEATAALKEYFEQVKEAADEVPESDVHDTSI